MKKGQTLKQIGFDEGIIAASVYMLRSSGWNVRETVAEMLGSYEPDRKQAPVGDLATLREFNL